MEINRDLRRLINDKKIQKIKAEAEKKIGREISDEDFLQGFYFALQQAERSKKKHV